MMIWVGHTSHAEEKTNTYTVLIGPLKERDHFVDLGIEEV
jgi:hypothetical protein